MSDQIRVRNAETGDETSMSRDHFDDWEARWPGEFVEITDDDKGGKGKTDGTVVVDPPRRQSVEF